MEDQQDVITFLASPATHDGAAVERIDTHASIVFLAGSRALKLKRAVRFDYLDFSTSERRRRFCEAEVRLNRRTAPGLYRGVMAVTRDAGGHLALNGTGEAVDWVVDMVRFDQANLFDRLASVRRLDLESMAPLGAAIARFHDAAASRVDHGGRAGMSWVIEGNATDLAARGQHYVDRSSCEAMTLAARAMLDRTATTLDARRDAGLVRECHGDLHLRNIVLLGGVPTLFDGIEFNDELSCVDVCYDLAFLLMDLWRRQLESQANAVLNGYLAVRTDFEALSLLPLFLSCRAAVRAKTSVTAAQLQTGTAVNDLATLAQGYIDLARRFLDPPAPCVIAVGGFSGSGKSTLARALAPSIGAAPGAVIVRSDVIRKRMFQVEPTTPLDPGRYGPEISRLVYATIAEHAAAVLRSGHSLIVDAAFLRPADRHMIARVTMDAGLAFRGIWLDAPLELLLDRVTRRHGDASDASADVVRVQVEEGPGAIDWTRVDASKLPDALVQEVRGR